MEINKQWRNFFLGDGSSDFQNSLERFRDATGKVVCLPSDIRYTEKKGSNLKLSGFTHFRSDLKNGHPTGYKNIFVCPKNFLWLFEILKIRRLIRKMSRTKSSYSPEKNFRHWHFIASFDIILNILFLDIAGSVCHCFHHGKELHISTSDNYFGAILQILLTIKKF